MQTKDINTKAQQDITIDELPKQDNPNNSDLVVIQGSSLTEATSIQQLRDKILGGGVGSGNDTIGIYRFSATVIEDSSWGLMDGTQYSKEEKEDFYNWLLEQDLTTKQAFSLDTIAEKFILPNYSGLGLKVTNSSGIKNMVGGVINHKHTFNLADGIETTPPAVFGVSYNYYLGSKTAGISGNNRAVVTLFYEGDSGSPAFGDITKIEATPNPKNTNNQTLSDVPYPYFTGFCYIKMTNSVVVDTVSSPFIKSDGSVSMNLDYAPTDLQDVVTKKYVDFKFLDIPLPLSFSINDIGKIIPFYHKAESNPTLIALDGSKYLIADYPDFDYQNIKDPLGNPCFTSDGVYFWLANLHARICEKSTGFFTSGLQYRPLDGSNVNSKFLYNMLMQSGNEDFIGTTFDKFQIINPTTYEIKLPNLNNPTNTDGSFKQLFYGNAGVMIAENTKFIQTTTQTNNTPQKMQIPKYIQVKPDYMVAKIQQVGGSSNIVVSDDVNFNNFRAINLGAPVDETDAARLVDLNSDNIIISNTSKEVETLTTKLTELDTIIQSQSNLITTLTTKLDSYDTKYRSFTSRYVKSGLNVTINSNATNLTNLTQYFVSSQNPVVTSFGSSISGLSLGGIVLIGVGSGINQGFKFPAVNGIVNSNLTFTVRVTGSISGPAGNPRELIVYLRRVSDNSIVANGGIIKVNDNNFNARSVIVPSFIQGASDAFYTGGFYLNLLNNSGGNLILTSLELLIQG